MPKAENELLFLQRLGSGRVPRGKPVKATVKTVGNAEATVAF